MKTKMNKKEDATRDRRRRRKRMKMAKGKRTRTEKAKHGERHTMQILRNDEKSRERSTKREVKRIT